MAGHLPAPIDPPPAPGAGPAERTPARTVREYLLAAVASGLAWVLSYPLEPYVDRGDFPLYLGAVMLSAWYGGLGPGLLTTLVGAFVGVKALVGSGVDATPLSAAVVTRLGVFGLEALVICAACGILRRTESRAQILAASEQSARLALEAAAHQIRAVQRVTDTALTHLDLDDLLPELLWRVREAMAADTVVILLLNDQGTELAVRAAHGLEEEVKLDMRIPFGRGIAGMIAARGATMVIEDVSAAEVVSPILRAKGLHTLLGTPLVLDGRGIGVVHVGSLSPRRFTPDDARLLELVADRIATAIGRARLFGAEQRARRDAETAEGRFRLLVDGVRDYAFYMLDRAGKVESWNAGAERLAGYTADEIVGQHVALFYLPEEARQGGAARTLERAATEGRAVEEGWRIRKDGSRFWAEVLVTAVRDGEGRFVGYSVVTHDVTERRRHAEVRARLLEQVTAAQEEEQRRLARELHDETGQSLTSLLVGLRTLAEAPNLDAAREQVAELRRVTARTLDEVRRLARGLRPGVLDELGLVPAVDQLALDYAQMRTIAVDVSAVGFGLERLPPAVEASLYRIIQEALTNTAKHSGARTANVVLQRRRDVVQAIVSDDGCGFDVEGTLRTPAAWAHLGLHGMRERAALLGGTVTIESTPGEGTTIYVRVPVFGGADGKDWDLIADDHAVLRTGLRMLIGSQRDLEVVGEASDGDEAVRKAAALRPDVALVDISMPGSSGIKAIERIREAAPATRVLVLTMHDMPAYLRAALAAGASGYVVKRAADSALLAAIRDVYRGRTALDPALAASVVQSGLRRRGAVGSSLPTPLSQREREVLELVAQGYTNQQIADHLGLSVKTVETYRARLVEKLGLQSRAELVRYALDSGLFGGEAGSTS